MGHSQILSEKTSSLLGIFSVAFRVESSKPLPNSDAGSPCIGISLLVLQAVQRSVPLHRHFILPYVSHLGKICSFNHLPVAKAAVFTRVVHVSVDMDKSWRTTPELRDEVLDGINSLWCVLQTTESWTVKGQLCIYQVAMCVRTYVHILA